MDNNTVEYINRYKDKIIFTLIDENTIKMEGGEHCRYGWNTDEELEAKRYTMVDPSGGPYINSGDDMGMFDKIWKGKIVDYITSEEDYYLIKLK